MSLTLYNTLTRREEVFEPAQPPRVTMYVCGPTVYSYPHIGNARPAVVFDVLARLLRRSYELTYARNITDVEDKINAAALEEGVPIEVITERFTQVYHDDMQALGVAEPDIEPRATQHMAEIIEMIQVLVNGDYAYEAQGHVLFNVARFSDYGVLSRRNRAEMIAGARVEVAPYKRDPGDFVLWKPSDADTVGWNSPWGRGRPGWHIECSAMVRPLTFTAGVWIWFSPITKTRSPRAPAPIAAATFVFGSTTVSSTWMQKKCPSPWVTYC